MHKLSKVQAKFLFCSSSRAPSHTCIHLHSPLPQPVPQFVSRPVPASVRSFHSPSCPRLSLFLSLHLACVLLLSEAFSTAVFAFVHLLALVSFGTLALDIYESIVDIDSRMLHPAGKLGDFVRFRCQRDVNNDSLVYPVVLPLVAPPRLPIHRK